MKDKLPFQMQFMITISEITVPITVRTKIHYDLCEVGNSVLLNVKSA